MTEKKKFEHGDEIETVEQLISKLAWSRWGLEYTPEEIKQELDEYNEKQEQE